MIDLLKDEEFEFWLPLALSKSKGDKEEGKRFVEGIASTTDLDLQAEVVNQSGIDFSYFLKFGYFNNDHKPGFENKVGQPTECKITSKGLWTKGFLFKNHKVADAIWELANAIEASQSDRKLGFSIQGKVLRRAGKTILKCWIQDIAITAAPVNTNTWLDIVKSLNDVPVDMWCAQPNEDKCTACGSCSSVRKSIPEKAIDESKMDIKKDDDHKCSCGSCKCQEKALSATSDAGRALTVESLEGDPKDQGYGRVGDKKKEVTKSLSFDECIDILQKHRKMTQPDALVVVEAVFQMNGISI